MFSTTPSNSITFANYNYLSLIPEVIGSLAQIKFYVKNGDLIALKTSLDKLCGGLDQAEIICESEENLQIQLYFTSEPLFRAALIALEDQFSCFNVSEIESKQIILKDATFTLDLQQDQSIALLHLDPNWQNSFDDGQTLLKNLCTKKITFPVFELPDEFLHLVFAQLPLKDVGLLTQINQRTFAFTQCDLFWETIALNLDFQLEKTSFPSAKQQIQEAYIKLPYGSIDLINKKINVKSNCLPLFYNTEEIDRVFEKYVPKGFYLQPFLKDGVFELLFRNEQGKTQKIYHICLMPNVVGKKLTWHGELEWTKVHNSMKEFGIVITKDL